MPKLPSSESGKKRIDIRDVAKHAGVSISTVSRTINHVPSVDKTLARKVWRSIKELNYYPNTHARSLVSGRSHIFGLLVPEITNPFFPELIQGFENVALDNGYEILISSTNHDPVRLERCMRRLLERKVDGVAVMTFGVEAPLWRQLEELSSQNIPLVFVDDAPHGPRMTGLKIDYETGFRQGVQHLAVLGHRQIAFIQGPEELLSSRLRKSAFVKAMTEIGCPESSLIFHTSDHTVESGFSAALELLKKDPEVTAIMCSNDLTAIGVLRALAREGVAVPGEMSVIGFDNIQLTEYVSPPLTSIQLSREDLSRNAFESLKSQLARKSGGVGVAPAPILTALNVRQSTAIPRTASNKLWSGGATNSPRKHQP